MSGILQFLQMVVQNLIEGGSIQFLKKWKIHDLDAYFWTIITC
jgi:hypothetical protein